MSNNAIETVMGAVVLAVASSFLYFAYDNSSVKPIQGYTVKARFTNITGVGVGSDVRVGGIKVGAIEALDLDPASYQAVATLRITDAVKLPTDSSASVQSAGLMGDKFIGLEPGGADETLSQGDTIHYTQPSVSLEEMIGKFVFSGGGADKGGDNNPATDAGDAPASAMSTGLE